MAKTLTESATYNPAVVVPEGDDSRDTAAEDVESFVQVLADRAKYLKAAVELRARLDADNTLAGRQTIVPPNATTPSIRATTPADVNSWAAWFETPCGAGPQRLRVYYGEGGAGYLMITVNAYWSAGHWHFENSLQRSHALWISGTDLGDLHYGSQFAGSAPWADWFTPDTGRLFAPAVIANEMLAQVSLYAQTLQSLSNVKAVTDVESATVTTHTQINCDHDVAIGGEYTFAAPQGVTTPINLGLCAGPSYLLGDGSVKLLDTSVGAQQEIAWAVLVPPGAKINQVRIRHAQGTATGDSFTLRRRVHGFSGGVFTVDNSVYVVADATVSSGKVTTMIASPPLNLTVAPEDEITLVWRLTDNGDITAIASNKVIALEVDWTRAKV